MNAKVAAALASLAVLPAAIAEQQEFPRLSERVPYFEKRLRSTRWQVRYCLLGNLDGRDSESKRALELLCRDENDAVGNQALRRYEMNFIGIDKSLFRPEVYLGGTFPGRTPAGGRELVDRCLARLQVAEKADGAGRDAADRDDPSLVDSITVVGIMGMRQDAAQLQPFLDSKNDYVAIRTAVAVIRLGERMKGGDALVRLTKRDPAKHLCYVTAALRFLKELEHPEFRLTLLDALAAVDRDEGIQPNWVSDFLLLAAEIDGNVWAPKAALGAAEAGERK